MDIQKIDISLIKPATYNPRKNLKPSDPEYQKIKRSIETFGYIDPVIVNSDMTCIGGHQRLKVLKDLGYAKIDCVVVDVDKDKERALNVALNKISGEWDMDALKEVLGELNESNQLLTGFDIGELKELFAMQAEPEEDNFDVDTAIDNIEQPSTKRGDVWQLGKHRLMCGDSTLKSDAERLMNGIKADMFITDPPYNVAYEGGTKEKLTIKNDNMKSEAFRTFLTDAFTNGYLSVKKGASAYIFHADSEGYNFRGAFCDAGFKLAQTCIWVKNSMVMGRQDYQWQHEPVLCGEKDEIEDTEWEPIIYGWNPSSRHYWHSNRKQKTVWYFDKPNKSKEHPTMKPIKLTAYPIQNSSNDGDVILDLFGGSGSTLIACEQTNRTCYIMELDEKY